MKRQYSYQYQSDYSRVITGFNGISHTMRIGFVLLLVIAALTISTTILAATEYTFGAGDKVKIQVLGEPDLGIETLVSDSGTISYPFLGEVKVQGMTAAELEQFIIDKLKGPYLVDPVVTVSLLQYRNFYVNGWVKTPGGYPFQPGITVRKAIALAGGFNERADRKNIVITHGKAPDTTPVKTQLSELIAPGDVITVKRSFF